VVAGGKLLFSSIDAHSVHALSADDGEELWSFTAGGRVDSPPTVHSGLALFGCADGWVYCLRLSDGKLAWRFRAAPEGRQVGDSGQLASAWPVPGSVLVQDGVAYCTAGRSTYLDGGIRFYGLDPATGNVLCRSRLHSPDPQTGEQPRPGADRTLAGALADILVGDGKHVYLRETRFDAAGAVQDPAGNAAHLIATGGFRDDAHFQRSAWTFDTVVTGYGRQGKRRRRPMVGQLLAFDDEVLYGVRGWTPAKDTEFDAGNGDYLLFAMARPKAGEPARRLRRGGAAYLWSVKVPIRVDAMLRAGRNLCLAGVPDAVDPGDPLAAYEGRAGGVLRTVSAGDGRTLSERKLEDAPVFDGMAAARGRLYLCTRAGRILCFE
jgi:hypothetical protein